VAKKPHASAKIAEGSLYIIVVLAAEVGVCVWVLLRLAVNTWSRKATWQNKRRHVVIRMISWRLLSWQPEILYILIVSIRIYLA
jgi:hypothetical protein